MISIIPDVTLLELDNILASPDAALIEYVIVTWFIFSKMIFTFLGMATPCPYCTGLALPNPTSKNFRQRVLVFSNLI